MSYYILLDGPEQGNELEEECECECHKCEYCDEDCDEDCDCDCHICGDCCEEGYVEYRDPETRVQDIVGQINEATGLSLSYSIQESNELNAWVDGKNVEITRVLIEQLNDDELAFIIGHEAGHAVKKHVEKRIERSRESWEGIEGFIDKPMKGHLKRTKKVLGTIGLFAFTLVGDRVESREDEYEADSEGKKLAEEAGFDSDAAQSALARLGFSSRTRILDTHPAIQSRIENLK